MDNNILLESGTNELEILEFAVGNNHYGINVAKVREILPYKTPTPVPNTHPSVEGIFMPRGEIITIVNLGKSLNIELPSIEGQDMYIITNFNKLNVGFHVQKVLGIQRLFWTQISKPDATINGAGEGIATGIVKLDDRLLVILDFEKIIADISPETGLRVSQLETIGARERISYPVLIAEDSQLLEKMIVDSLNKAGYVNVIRTENGQEAWDQLCKFKEMGDIEKYVRLVVTDIEMPQMDGHRLTKLIKTDPVLQKLPVIIFSSLINRDSQKKGESVGADFQLTKPEIGQLVDAIDRLILKTEQEKLQEQQQ